MLTNPRAIFPDMESHTTLQTILDNQIKLTPMMEQYVQIKKQHPTLLLFFRMGDFYELFFEDAVCVAKLLNLNLTHRGKLGDYSIPMAGIPHHAAKHYLGKLTSQGYKVVICDQLEDPAMAQGIVKRGISQVVGPAIPYNLTTDEADNHFIACACPEIKSNGADPAIFIMLIDYTTGVLKGQQGVGISFLKDIINKFKPKEFLLAKGMWEFEDQIVEFLQAQNILSTYLPKIYFNFREHTQLLNQLVPNIKLDKNLNSHPSFLSLLSVLGNYLLQNRPLDEIEHIQHFEIEKSDCHLKISPKTLEHLDLLPMSAHQKKNQFSLFHFLDFTLTPQGKRHLRDQLLNPFKELTSIQSRLQAVNYFHDQHDKRTQLQEILKCCFDLDRFFSKISSKTVQISDLIQLAHSITFCEWIENEIHYLQLIPSKVNAMTMEISKKLIALKNNILKTLNDELGASLTKGNAIKSGVDATRDKWANLTINNEVVLKEMEDRYQKLTAATKLKIKFNHQAGYFIEVPKGQSKLLESHLTLFQRRQTLTLVERFSTAELQQFENDIKDAQNSLWEREKFIFDSLIMEIKNHQSPIQCLTKNIAHFDLIQSLAEVAARNSWTTPEFSPSGHCLKVEYAIHPLVKQQNKGEFKPLHFELDPHLHFVLITGPNMAGKSTCMKTLAIIQFLAQMGSMVPAKKAMLSVRDAIFTRIGAQDELSLGQSTFMVEMSETAEIIRHATEHSLILLDEVGRGTSTYDGLSIAWGLVNYFCKVKKSLTFFSTHYFELIDVVEAHKNAVNYHIEVKTSGEKVEFLYGLVKGGAKKSFGHHVAKLAGIPSSILKDSQEIYEKIQSQKQKAKTKEPIQLNLFEPNHEYLALKESLLQLDINSMTPLDALNKLGEIQTKLFQLH